MNNTVKIIECPRDAWQGLPLTIPSEVKAEYLRALVTAGFRQIDAVSFVSSRPSRRWPTPSRRSRSHRLERRRNHRHRRQPAGVERAINSGGVNTLGSLTPSPPASLSAISARHRKKPSMPSKPRLARLQGRPRRRCLHLHGIRQPLRRHVERRRSRRRLRPAADSGYPPSRSPTPWASPPRSLSRRSSPLSLPTRRDRAWRPSPRASGAGRRQNIRRLPRRLPPLRLRHRRTGRMSLRPGRSRRQRAYGDCAVHIVRARRDPTPLADLTPVIAANRSIAEKYAGVKQ